MFTLTLWFSWQKDVKAEMPGSKSGIKLRNNYNEDKGPCRISLVSDGQNWIEVLKIPLKWADMLNVKRAVGYFEPRISVPGS